MCCLAWRKTSDVCLDVFKIIMDYNGLYTFWAFWPSWAN
jgi:hypothetical protein